MTDGDERAADAADDEGGDAHDAADAEAGGDAGRNGDVVEDADVVVEAAEDVDLDADVASDDTSPFRQVLDVVVGEPTLSLDEVAERAGLPREVLREAFAAMDWADRPGYDERDVGYAEDIRAMLDHYPMDAVVRALRNRARAMTTIVVGDLGTVRDQLIQPGVAMGEDVEDIAEKLGRTAAQILPHSTQHLSEDYRHVLVRILESETFAKGIDFEGREVQLAVGFVDVVGYTALSGRIDPAGLDHVLAGFEDLVTRAAAGTEDVLLAKFIGDAAMLVSPDVVKLTEVLVALVESKERLAEAPRRAGVAAGPVLVREGDYYGPTTNLAARLTDHARPWSLLASEDLEERLDDHFSLSEIPETTIRGVGERRPLRVRRRGDDD